MEELIIRQTTNGKELYNLRQKGYEIRFHDWLNTRKPLTLDNPTLVILLGIKSFKELENIDKSKLNKQDLKAVNEALKYCTWN